MKIVTTTFMAIFALTFVVIAGVAGAAPSMTGPMDQVPPAGEVDVDVLSNPRIAFRPQARMDVEAGRVDPRVLGLLQVLSQRFEVGGVGPFKSGHSYYVAGTRHVSNHSFGRAVDIFRIDGRPVSSSNASAREAVLLILGLQKPLRPDETGSPWRFPASGSFTDRAHWDHIHVGWDSP